MGQFFVAILFLAHHSLLVSFCSRVRLHLWFSCCKCGEILINHHPVSPCGIVMCFSVDGVMCLLVFFVYFLAYFLYISLIVFEGVFTHGNSQSSLIQTPPHSPSPSTSSSTSSSSGGSCPHISPSTSSSSLHPFATSTIGVVKGKLQKKGKIIV